MATDNKGECDYCRRSEVEIERVTLRGLLACVDCSPNADDDRSPGPRGDECHVERE